MEDMELTELIDLSMMQRLQDLFAQMTGFAALTTDAEGKPVTRGSNFTMFCEKYMRGSRKGCAECEKCDRFGAESVLTTGRASAYLCHAGLFDFAAPIMVEGRMVGGFIGGQALTQAPNRQLIQGVARDIGADFDACWSALQQVPVIDRKKLDSAASFLWDITLVLSDIATGNYQAAEARREIERAANMKTDFLANMSHEIRTPMNAVIGMAEMALREDLTPAARDYISQIKSSGNALLNIINDILDFSKIESGKMDIIPERYEPLSMLHDISGVLMARAKDKDIEVMLSMDPMLPEYLEGDDIRVRQILINIANNAIKFTRHGHVDIHVDYEKNGADGIILKIAVHDTGIGIKKEDLGKLFESFQQVDSKRNRNIEGTGLGLAITRRLLELMDGEVHVESSYGKGSRFSFSVPQKVADWTPCMEIAHRDSMMAIGYWGNITFAKQFYRDMQRLGVEAVALTALDRYGELCEMYEEEMKGRELFFFTDALNIDGDFQSFVENHPQIQFVILTDFYSSEKPAQPNVKYLKKPLSTLGLAMILNCDDAMLHSDAESFEFDFIAPEARVLIVDDNEVNLTVSEGLLEPLRMKITRALSGKAALKLLEKERFDLVFMDHMMPELDGVETTRIIRRLHPTLNDMPIIALTANAVGDARQMFLAEGVNDFVAKPIELRTIVTKIRQWLPPEKIIKGSFSLAGKSNEKIVVGDLDTETALQMIGSESLFWTILGKYYEAIEPKSVEIKKYEMEEDIAAYTIEVHALKSASRQIGAKKLSDLAAELEQAGKQGDLMKIHQKTDQLLQLYVGYLDVMKPFVQKKTDSSAEKKAVTGEILETLFGDMREAAENLDMDGMDETIRRMDQYEYTGVSFDYFQELQKAVSEIDVERCAEILTMWQKIL